MINITLNIDEKKFNADLERSFVNYNRALKSFKEKVVEDVRAVQRDNILQERRFDGGALESLSPITVYLKTKLGFAFPNRILYASGLLSRSVQSQHDSDDASNVFIGNNRDYIAWKQQTGQLTTWFGRTFKLPERPFFGLSVFTTEKVQKRIDDFNLNV